MLGPIDINKIRKGYHSELTRQTTSVARSCPILLGSTNAQGKATPGSGAVRIACPNFADLVVGVTYGLPDWERIRGWIACQKMTDEEFDDALKALSEGKYLRQVAEKSGFAADSQDAVQDVLLTFAAMKPHQYRNIGDLKPYAQEAVRRRAIRLAVTRKDNKWPHVKMGDDDPQKLEQTSYRDPYESYELEQMRKFIHDTIEFLDPLERSVVRAHLDGESGPAFASRTDLTVDVVRGVRERVWKKLKRAFQVLMREDGQEGSR